MSSMANGTRKLVMYDEQSTTCRKVLWFDHMCTELYDHTGDNNGTIKQNTELIIHQHSQSRPNPSMYIKLSTYHNPLALSTKICCFPNLEPWFTWLYIFQTQHCWSLILFLTAVQGERSPLSVRHLCISNDHSQHQKINFHHCRHTSASIHWYQESQCSPPQPQFFNLATHQSQHSIYIHIYMYTMTAQTTNYCGPCSIAIMVYRLIFGSPNLG